MVTRFTVSQVPQIHKEGDKRSPGGFSFSRLLLLSQKLMPSFISDQKSSKSAQEAVSVSPVNFTPTVPVPQAHSKNKNLSRII